MTKPSGMSATASAQLEQNRECPPGTRATPERGAMRQTSHISRCGVAVAAAVVTAAVALADGVQSTSSPGRRRRCCRPT